MRGGGSASSQAGKTLVVDASFDLKTADPNRSYETTGQIIAKAMYETLLTFKGSDVTTPVDGLASYEMNADNTVMTLTMKDGHVFSDGSPVTVDDAVFSLTRLQGIKGNPSFLLDGLTIEKVDDKTLTITSPEPRPELPFILPNGALSVVNQETVEAHGGTNTEADSAESFLNSESAGSGPYVLDSFDAAKQVVLTANENYTGTKPKYERIVLRNVEGPTQKLNVEKGESQLALDLNPDQVAELAGANVNITSNASRYMIFFFLNQNKNVNAWTSNPDFVQAVKLGVDYDKIVALAGEGAVRPGGPIPSLFVGALDAAAGNQRDIAAAKAALAASGYNGEAVTLNFPNDITVQGLSFTSIAESLQAQLAEIGINIQLAPAPVATELDAYRNGQETIGLWYWGPDFPHPSNYLVFSPGQLVGLRAGWESEADPKMVALANAAKTAGESEVESAYKEWQEYQNEAGPFIPLLQPGQSIVTSKSISSVVANPIWTVDLALID
ncbi:ABC transporter substrate-binding protein [Canibacter zhoujuaniae]|uniref:ABC transporter substrate-binding protein n=1 Tax=Canibacter zhoujuaniae TaxID=2708343 RepID=UPI0014227F6F|nr:ABC transporter substrate-binding protein [Canibacter zhoujuaniae]